MKPTIRPVAVAVITALFAAMLMAATASANEVLCNPGFENPAAPGCWTFTSDPPDQAAVTANWPRTGEYSAELCDGPCDARVAQNYVVPQDVVSATLTFWGRPFRHGDMGTTCADNLFAAVESSTEAIRTDPICADWDTNGTWNQRTLDATAFLQAHGGESVVIALIAQNLEANDFLTWFVDDISLDVETAAPTTHPRTVTLNLRRHLIATGKVTTDGYRPCVAGIGVKVQKRAAGKWHTIKATTTTDLGTFKVRLRDRAGKYRVKAPALEPVPDRMCGGALSVVRVHRH